MYNIFKVGCKRIKHCFVLHVRFINNRPYLRHILTASIQLGIRLHIDLSPCHICRKHCNLRCNFLDNFVHTNRLDNLLSIKHQHWKQMRAKKKKNNTNVPKCCRVSRFDRFYYHFVVEYNVTSVWNLQKLFINYTNNIQL